MTLVSDVAGVDRAPGRSRARAIGLACAAVVVAIVAYEYRVLSFTEFSNDDFVHLSIAQQVLRGALPVRDFAERGFPLMWAVSALGQATLGTGLWSELRVVSALLAATAALVVLVGTIASGSLTVGILAALIVVLAYPVSYSYPKLLVYAIAFAAAWMYLRRPSAGRLLAAGVSVAIAFLFRHDHGVFVALGMTAAIVARNGFSRGAWLQVAKLGIVAGLCVAPYLGWVQVHQGIGVYVANAVRFSRREAEKATWAHPPAFGISRGPLLTRLAQGPVVHIRWEPAIPEAVVAAAEARHGLTRLDPVGPRSYQYELSDWSPEAIARLVRDPSVADTDGIDRDAHTLKVPAPSGLDRLLVHLWAPGPAMRVEPNALAVVYYAVWLLPLAALLVLARAWTSLSVDVRALVVMAIVIQLLSDVTMLRDPLDNRIREVVVQGSVLLAFLAGWLWHAGRTTSARIAVRTITTVMLAGAVAAAGVLGGAAVHVPDMRMQDGRHAVSRQFRSVRYRLGPPQERTGDRLSAEYRALVRYVRSCTAPDARVFALAYAPELFFYTGRSFAGGQVTLTPGYFATPREEQAMLVQLDREDVPLVVIDSQIRGEMLRQYPRVAGWLATRYHDVGRFTVGVGRDFVVLADRRRAVTGTFGDARLPCFVDPARGDTDATVPRQTLGVLS